ncbi:tetratricopeptide repeat-containing sensor histidine kinase [Muriicola marianensis]|uniref:tetratricopeptide repeat-containing sensor histidine kinase n=1 Tax=Muriicola marianensis TaxID=1324801 RepID=UPI00166343D6|nr:tetratricopeptide repeat-containing sensor histidine kinase [Muriicola marianensis]
MEQIKESNLPVENHLDQLDEVYSQLGQVSVDTLKIQYLSQLSLITSKIVDSQLFQNVNRDFEKLAGELQDSVKLAEAFWDKGAYFDLPDIAQRDSAYLYFSKAQKIFQQLEDDISSSSVLRAMASVQTDVHDNTGAIVNATEAIRLLKPYDEYKKLYYAYNTMGIAYAALKEYDQALEYYNLAEEQLQKLKSESIELASLKNNIGYLYSNKGDFLNAKKEFQEAISTDSLLWYKPDLYAKLLDHLAITNFKLGIMDSVEENLYRSQFIRDSIGDLEGLSLNYYNLALVNKEIGRKADAFIFAGNARDLAKEIDNNLRYLESLRLLSELDPENSSYYLNEYSEMSENLLQEERRIRNKFANIKFETEETENRNRQLARQQLIWIGIAVGLLLFAIALSIIVVQRIKNQRLKFQQQQQEANQEIFNLMLAQKQKVEEGKQSEQKRISEELHDGILGEMNGVRMVLLGLNKKGDDAAVALREQAIEKLKEVQEEIRSISHELNDASYQKFNNFMNSIEDLLKNTVEPAGIQYHFSYDQDLDWDQLEGVTKINLYRILQESLQNCIKHAAATSIYVSFEVDGYQIVITIQDNGRGFETGKGKKGIGHKNIESRVRKIRGKWYLKSAPGIGTTVLLEIPMEHISQEAKKEISLPKDLQEV